MSTQTARVIPYVEDRRNALLLEPAEQPRRGGLTSLQAALKKAIQVRYQLEDGEIGSEPLPTRDERRQILFYESAEGGAGVLRRLVDEPSAFAHVAREALRTATSIPRRAATAAVPREQPRTAKWPVTTA